MNCYVMDIHSGAELPRELTKENTMFYPESRMTTQQQCTTARPRDFHIVTNSHFLVPLYKREEVFIWRDGEWVNPERQTYACSFNIILSDIFEIESTIPQATLDGKVTNCMGRKIKEE